MSEPIQPHAPAFLFEDDCYSSYDTLAIYRQDDEVNIRLRGVDEPICYSFKDEADAAKKCAEAIAAWRVSMNSI